MEDNPKPPSSPIQPEYLSAAQVAKLERDKERKAKKVAAQRLRRAAKKVAKIASLASIDPVKAMRANNGPLAPVSHGGKLFKALFLELLMKVEAGYGVTYAERLARQIFTQAYEGDIESQKLILDRTDGKVLAENAADTAASSGLTIMVANGGMVAIDAKAPQTNATSPVEPPNVEPSPTNAETPPTPSAAAAKIATFADSDANNSQ